MSLWTAIQAKHHGGGTASEIAGKIGADYRACFHLFGGSTLNDALIRLVTSAQAGAVLG
jgi:hypothetical protein